jgi:high frequency lysogenization protein
MKSKVHDRTLAMAGLYQCVDSVTQLAWKGNLPPGPFEACLRSLFDVEPESYESIYGGLPGLKRGLEVLHSTLKRQHDAHDMDRTRYSIILIFLEKRLSKNKREIDEIKSGIEAATQQLVHFEMTHINVISKLADIYRQFISPLGPKIIVRGEQTYLSNPDNASRIRTLLLAGIRAALLWRQAGGNRWRLLFERSAMIKEIDSILAGM